MGVFGEKHTSLTREQKRQLIHQADTHKLRPTEVCDWVQATWGLRIARVTVYSILHKQRASLMAGHKDLYQTMQNSLGLTSSTANGDGTVVGFTNTMALAQDACLLQSKDGQRVNKYRVSPNKNRNKDAASTASSKVSASVSATTLVSNKKASNTDSSSKSKRSRSVSVASDRSSVSAEGTPGEVGTRWEGQLKRVREPASVELDRAMVAFLKSPASVDSQGRRLNDAELQSHALRLAQSIPSASRMRCSFGWLRHFKRRLGVQWAADRLGKYRWIVEMDHHENQSSVSSTTSTPSPTDGGVKVKVEQDGSEGVVYQGENGAQDGEDDDDVDEEYHSTHEFSPAAPSPKKRSRHSGPTDASQSFAAGVLSTSTMMQQPQCSDSSILSIQPTASLLQHQSYEQQSQPQHQSPQAIMDAYPNLFGSMTGLQLPCLMSTISPMATTLDPTKLASTTSATASTAGSVPAAAFGMSVDGKMRKVPSKEEAYDMLQSLLMYYEQDHSYIGEQQTLLLPRWIHQQRQIMTQTQETEARMLWMRQQQQQMQQQQQQQQIHSQLFGSSFPSFDSQSLLGHGQLQQQLQQNQMFFQQQNQKMSHQQPQQSYHRYHSSFSSTSSDSSSSTSPSSLSPISPTLSSPPPMPAMNRLDEFLAGTGAAVRASTLTSVDDDLEEAHSSSFSAAGLWPLTA
ncbi:hypothetical protein EMPS_10979 [Entomortierella parvispora]|uniref:HTH CENPB-type domain-containing protein n=1 Tax=Entomortierella parvispora TaxID=205924 RepID=A0A9P3HL74_9FUNG|nr:hypothetical protein EMPS_10979 [Entomortierella parvispora]